MIEIKIKGQLRQSVVGLTPQQFIQEMKYNLNKANNLIMDYYGQFTHTWRHSPGFNSKTSYDINNLFTQVTSVDDILKFLDFGTANRYAVMARSFRAKTSVDTIRSGKGAGNPDPVRRGKRSPRMPGIDARNISLTIAEQIAKDMQADNKRVISGIITATITGGTRK